MTKSEFRRAKVICTVGPASQDPAVFRSMVEAGADAVRVNFSHASHDAAGRIIAMTREAGEELGRPLAVIADLQGPKIRVGDLEAPLRIEAGERYCLVPQGAAAGAVPEGFDTGRVIPTTYPELARDIAEGDRVLLDDGRLEFTVLEIRGDSVVVESAGSGTLEAQKGINLPGVMVGAPAVTAKDREDLRFAVEHEVDFVALSFVRRPGDLTDLRAEMDGGGLIISKIEKDQALDSLSEIIRGSDSAMVARGDLGVELPYEEVPMVQKRIIRLGQELARPSITATQMLESMTRAPRPTRAEVSDVATALLDGTDAVMLSAETAIGDYPVEAVQAISRIIRRIEREGPPYPSHIRERPREERTRVQQSTSGAIAAAALQAVARLGAPFLVTFTRSGFTARVVAAQRPPVPILAVTDQPRTYRQLAISWGVHPLLFQDGINYENMLEYAREVALAEGFGEPGDRFAVTAGIPFHVTGTTNMIRIEEL